MSTLLNMKATAATLGLASMLLASCSNQRMGTIEGNITGAEGQLLVLEHLTDGIPQMVDTLRLTADGKFEFQTEVEPGPDFYSLRLGNQSIQLVIDTLLTPVKVTASAENMISNYQVSDPGNQELKEAVQHGNRLRGQILNVNQVFNQGGLGREQARDSILSLVNIYKKQVLAQYIYKNPASPASYYLMFETVQGLQIFDVTVREDNRAFGAVANSWKFNYPASPRNKMLEKMTIAGQRQLIAARRRAQEADSIAKNTPIEVRTFPELRYTDIDDHDVSLTETADGAKLTLVDFTAYYMDYSPVHNMTLSKLYEQYSSQGLKVYQVCLDYDEHFWKTSAGNLPWTSVHDKSVLFDQQGNIQYSAAALTYNVSKLPTTFVIDANGQILHRIEADDAAIEKATTAAIR
ncbi:MAG: AhpC/TSA family protein [Bacteroidales bacterium]|nr:AhpC/TSA family protein [Bacteroidales bacterium]